MRAPSGLRTEPWASCWANRTECEDRVRDLRDGPCTTRPLYITDLHCYDLRAYGRLPGLCREHGVAVSTLFVGGSRVVSREDDLRGGRTAWRGIDDSASGSSKFHTKQNFQPWTCHGRLVRRAES